MKTLMAYWYHFAIMFEALFILTTIDAGTRVARYIVQELLGRSRPRFGEHSPGGRACIGISAVIVLRWGWLLYHGDIATIWPMFGVANQLLAAVALVIGTVIILTHAPRRSYALTTAIPFVFLFVTTSYAAVLNIKDTYWPRTHEAGTTSAAWANIVMTVIMLVLVAMLTVEIAKKALELCMRPPSTAKLAEAT